MRYSFLRWLPRLSPTQLFLLSTGPMALGFLLLLGCIALSVPGIRAPHHSFQVLLVAIQAFLFLYAAGMTLLTSWAVAVYRLLTQHSSFCPFRRHQQLFQAAAFLLAIHSLALPCCLPLALSFHGDTTLIALLACCSLLGYPALIAGICCAWLLARLLKTAETGAPASWNDYAGDFLLLLFFPLGTWLLQPRVRKLALSDASTTANTHKDKPFGNQLGDNATFR